MVEYLYDCIIAMSGYPIIIDAKITDDDGVDITSGCKLKLFDKEYNGFCENAQWTFIVPAADTENKHGRFMYVIEHNNVGISFPAPVYIKEL